MAVTPDDRGQLTLLKRLRAEQAQNRTDIQRLWKLIQRQQSTPPTVTKKP
jgi:hypothetical protein